MMLWQFVRLGKDIHLGITSHQEFAGWDAHKVNEDGRIKRE